MNRTHCMQRKVLPSLGQRLKTMVGGQNMDSWSGLQPRRAFHQRAYYPNGVLKPMPDSTSFAMGRVVCAVIPGLFIGAAISKSVANFLEENDLFVPDDDDDVDNDD